MMAPIHVAAHIGNMNRVKALLNQGVPVNTRTDDGWTPLHIAAKNGKLEVVKELLRRGARVNARNHWGYTPLHYAISWGHSRVAHVLVEAGAKILYRTENGEAPFNLGKHYESSRFAARTAAGTYLLRVFKKQKAGRMLLSPRLFGGTSLDTNSIRKISRLVTVRKKY
jgi:hypothetical protein